MTRPLIMAMFESVMIRSRVFLCSAWNKKLLKTKSKASCALWKHLMSPRNPIVSNCSRIEFKLTKLSSTQIIVLSRYITAKLLISG